MEFKVIEKKENALLERTEVNAEISFSAATPSTKEMRDTIVQKLGCNPDLMVISQAEPRFGQKAMSIKAHIYKAPEQLKRVEEAHVLKSNGVGQEAPKEEAKEEAPKEEAPKEAPKEEAPKEAPKEEKKEEAPKEKEAAPAEEKKE
jgi:ribosomal protein S24E